MAFDDAAFRRLKAYADRLGRPPSRAPYHPPDCSYDCDDASALATLVQAERASREARDQALLAEMKAAGNVCFTYEAPLRPEEGPTGVIYGLCTRATYAYLQQEAPELVRRGFYGPGDDAVLQLGSEGLPSCIARSVLRKMHPVRNLGQVVIVNDSEFHDFDWGQVVQDNTRLARAFSKCQ